MNRAAKLFLALWLGGWASLCMAAPEPRFALVIGNVAYSGPAVRLANPVRDAELIAHTLEQLGFEVTLETNLSRRATYDALDKYAARLQGDAVGLVFYSGHGVGFKGANYLIPVDGWPRDPAMLESDAVPLDEVLRRLSRRHNRLNIVIIDACRDNPFAGRYRSIDRGFAATQAPAGTILAFSTAPGAPALDGSGQQHSPYAQAISAGMLEKGVAIERMFKNVREVVGKATGGEQIPWENSSLSGADFYLAPPDGAPAFVPTNIAVNRTSRGNGGVTKGLNAFDWMAEYAEIDSRQRYLTRKQLPALERAAERGDATSQTLLGMAYGEGAQGLARNYRLAMRWLQRAVDRKNAIAMHELAGFYFAGHGTARSPERAFKLVSDSAEAGFPPAMATLGQFYMQGVGVQADAVKGLQLITASMGYGTLMQGNARGMTLSTGASNDHLKNGNKRR